MFGCECGDFVTLRELFVTLFKMVAFAFEISLLVGLLILYILFKKRNPLDDIPGPKPYPVIGNVLQLDMTKPFIQFTNLAKQYGGIFKIKLFTTPVVIVNDPRSIQEVLIKQSAEFAGRPLSFRFQTTSMDYSEIAFTPPGPAHKARRKAVQKYVKQYGSGITRIEEITQSAH